MTSSHSCSLMLKIMRSRRMPATLTRMSSAPEVVERRLDQVLAALDRRDGVEVRRRPCRPRTWISSTTSAAGPLSGARAVDVHAEVVDDDVRAFLGQQHRDAAADAAPGAGDDRDASFESCPSAAPPAAAACCGPAGDLEVGRRRRRVRDAGHQLRRARSRPARRASTCRASRSCASAAGARRGRRVPPATWKIWPLMFQASSLARYAAIGATYSGSRSGGGRAGGAVRRGAADAGARAQLARRVAAPSPSCASRRRARSRCR